jgi:uncharacterized protein (DUF427 family)
MIGILAMTYHFFTLTHPMKAYWDQTLIAESDDVKVVEGDYFFPHESLKAEYFVPSTTRSMSPREGEAHYYDIVVGGAQNKDAAWFYPHPIRVPEITNYVAFWKGVQITE